MEKIYFYGLIASLVVFLTPLFFIGGLMLSPSKNLEECNVLVDNGEDSIGIVFLSNKENAEEISEGLFSIEPFNSRRGDFSVFYVDYEPECELYRGKAILCSSSKENYRKAGSCPADYIIAVSDNYDRSVRSSSFKGVISLNAKHPYQTVAHEMAHALSNLADEYVPAVLPKDAPNCVNVCEEFDGKNEGCFLGCSDSRYFRSIDNGLMRTLKTDDFGDFNEEVLKEEIKKDYGSGILGFAVKDLESGRDCSSERYYLVEFSDGVKIERASVENGCSSRRGIGGFEASLIQEDNMALSKSFNKIIFSDVEVEERLTGGSEEFKGNSFLSIPFLERGADKIVVTSNEEVISELNLKGVDSLPCEI